MKSILQKYLKITLTIYLLTLIIPSFYIEGPVPAFLTATLILTVLYYILRPLINLILFPLHLITLQMTAWIVNLSLVFIWHFLISSVKIGSFELSQLNIGALHISHLYLASWVVTLLIGILLTLIVQCLDWVTD